MPIIILNASVKNFQFQAAAAVYTEKKSF